MMVKAPKTYCEGYANENCALVSFLISAPWRKYVLIPQRFSMTLSFPFQTPTSFKVIMYKICNYY